VDRKFASRGSKSGRFESSWLRSVAVMDRGLIRVGYPQIASDAIRFELAGQRPNRGVWAVGYLVEIFFAVRS
jgi:hypothetical protein